MKLFSLFSPKLPLDTVKIEQAIAHLERQTSAELRVVVERKAKTIRAENGAIARATELFYELEMDKTAERNAVLLYLSFKPHYIAVIGDEGIHQKVGGDFWQAVYQEMKIRCQAGEFTDAVCDGIVQVEAALAEHFPIQADDSNELSNEVIIK